jgi:PAS domain S-box-containing protein
VSENDYNHVHNSGEWSGEIMGVDDAPNSTNSKKEDLSIQTHISNLVRASEQRFETVFELIAEGIIYQNLEGRIVLCNEASAEILGLTVDQMEGGMPTNFKWQALSEEGTPIVEEKHPAMIALRTGTRQTNVVMSVCKPDGARVWIKVNSVPIFVTSSSYPVSVVTSFSDVSEIKLKEERLRIELKDLQQSHSAVETRMTA